MSVAAPGEGIYARVSLASDESFPRTIRPFGLDANLDDIDDLFVVFADLEGVLIAGFDGTLLEGDLTIEDATWRWRLDTNDQVFPHVADLDRDGDDDLLLVSPSSQTFYLGYTRGE